jgi:Cu/Ag efflux pump CusA
MIDAIIEFSARNRFLVVLTAAVLAALGWHSMQTMALDAIPDLSDTQVIIASRWDRSPDILEDQVTYPIVSAMLGAPRVRSVRGFSDFGYIIDLVIEHDIVEGEFAVRVIDSRYRTAQVNGREYRGLMALFPALAMELRPETGWEDWSDGVEAPE